MFDPETQKWSTFITLADDYAASDHGSVVRKGKIYVFGGYDEFFSVVKTKAFSIDVRNDGNIENHTPMLTKRGDVAAVYYNHGKIDAAYIIGGFNDDNNFCAPLTTVERYNFASDSWTESSSDQIYLGSARGDKAAVVMDRKILAIGGEDKHEDFVSNIISMELGLLISNCESHIYFSVRALIILILSRILWPLTRLKCSTHLQRILRGSTCLISQKYDSVHRQQLT